MAETFDLVAQRYGYTLEKFYALTRRQLFHLCKAITKSKNEERKFEANCAGREINEAMVARIVTPEQAKKEDEMVKNQMARMNQKHLKFKLELEAKAAQKK